MLVRTSKGLDFDMTPSLMNLFSEGMVPLSIFERMEGRLNNVIFSGSLCCAMLVEVEFSLDVELDSCLRTSQVDLL